jgi:hypothetical protein
MNVQRTTLIRLHQSIVRRNLSKNSFFPNSYIVFEKTFYLAMEEFCGTNGILDTIMDEVQALSKLVDFLCARLCGIQPIHTKSKLRRVGQVIGGNGEPNIW